MAKHLARHVFKGPDAEALADSTVLFLWHMCCAAAERLERKKPDPLGEALNSGDGTYRP